MSNPQVSATSATGAVQNTTQQSTPQQNVVNANDDVSIYEQAQQQLTLQDGKGTYHVETDVQKEATTVSFEGAKKQVLHTRFGKVVKYYDENGAIIGTENYKGNKKDDVFAYKYDESSKMNTRMVQHIYSDGTVKSENWTFNGKDIDESYQYSWDLTGLLQTILKGYGEEVIYDISDNKKDYII